MGEVKVYLNGAYLPEQDAKISVFDRGFIFGDGVYEVVPVFAGRPFLLDRHLARLQRSLDAISLANPYAETQWRDIASRLIKANDPQQKKADMIIYIQITRGVAPRDHGFPTGTSPTVFAYAKMQTYSKDEMLRKGLSAVVLEDNRWQRCDIKTISLLGNVLLRQQSVERGADEAILVRDGEVSEGAASNIFIVVKGQCFTPPNGPFILPGVTRDLLLQLARKEGVACEEKKISDSELRAADEIWLCSSGRELLPVTTLDGTKVGTGEPGPLFQRVLGLYQAYKREYAG